MLSKNNKAEDITTLNFKIYYKAIVKKTVWHQHENGHLDEQNRRYAVIQ